MGGFEGGIDSLWRKTDAMVMVYHYSYTEMERHIRGTPAGWAPSEAVR
jgi:hypothetical protein